MSIVIVSLLVVVICYVYNVVVRGPAKVRALLQKQGLTGPPAFPLLGNILDILKAKSPPPSSPENISHNSCESVFPFIAQWIRQYGNKFVFSIASTHVVVANNADHIKEFTTCTSLDLGKPSSQKRDLGALLGQGILTSNGSEWAFHRKSLASSFTMEKVKAMTGIICESSLAMVKSWNAIIEREGGVAEINVDQSLRCFSGDVISKACFGSNYSEGEKIFDRLRALQHIESAKIFTKGIPGFRYIPTKSAREAWALEKEIRDSILKIAKERELGGEPGVGYVKDMLDGVLEVAKNSDMSRDAKDRFVVDNCKNIYLAGFETTANSSSWCFMLLASNPEWQDRVRAEVLEVCGGQLPNYDSIKKMKQLAMVINENLRLYPPVAIVTREALKDMKLGNIHVPKGVNVWSMAMAAQTDPAVWGHDSYEFKPERFATGVAGATKQPHMYFPFGVGPRSCLGQQLALVELKMLFAILVSNFTFTISPKYVHQPVMNLITEPKHGVLVVVKKL